MHRKIGIMLVLYLLFLMVGIYIAISVWRSNSPVMNDSCSLTYVYPYLRQDCRREQ